MNNPNDMGRRIRALRKSRGLSIKELADAAYISEKYLLTIEICNDIPNVDILSRLCDALETTAEFLLGLRIPLKPLLQ